MNQLIRITDNSQGEKEVLASELHAWLGIKTNLSNWLRRTLPYGFEEGKDFTPKMTESTGGRPVNDYLFTIDAAKAISMLAKTERGKQARRYFIECEKQFKSNLLKQSSMVQQLRDHITQLETWHRGYVEDVERDKLINKRK